MLLGTLLQYKSSKYVSNNQDMIQISVWLLFISSLKSTKLKSVSFEKLLLWWKNNELLFSILSISFKFGLNKKIRSLIKKLTCIFLFIVVKDLLQKNWFLKHLRSGFIIPNRFAVSWKGMGQTAKTLVWLLLLSSVSECLKNKLIIICC